MVKCGLTGGAVGPLASGESGWSGSLGGADNRQHMIAVTTHSQTRGLRYTMPMLLAGRLIERQLRDASGCERYANVMVGPREFWTLTIWRDAVDMQRCMRDGAHGRVTWQQPHWLECYWGMRWRPGDHTSGEWEGDALEWPESATGASDSDSGDRPLATMPSWMQAALGKSVMTEQRQLAGAAGATYRLRVPPWWIPSALRDLRRLRRTAAADPDSFRLSLGVGTGGALYLLVISTSREGLDRLRSSSEHGQFLSRWGDRTWWSTWEPESEFGHWESQRLRDGQLADEPLLLDVTLPVRPTAAREARKTLRAGFDTLDTDTLEVLQLLTSELVVNSTQHAGLEPKDQIGLHVRARRDCIRVEVIERGRPFEPHVPLSKPPEDVSGWGLFVVNQMADRWGITRRSGKRHVWFELRTPVADPAQ